jgi:hypothetical protein
MEVHHSDHPGHKKKWHEYLLEFLMLFLAVFLGFLVENFREHQVEKSRTKEHMYTMVENLKFDTTKYGTALRGSLTAMKGVDSFRHQIHEAIQGRVEANKLYYYNWKYGRYYTKAVTNASAITQLKSSGMLRMVKNDSLFSAIGEYYERAYVALEASWENAVKRRDKLMDTYSMIFSYMGFDEILQRDTVMANGTDTYRNYIDGILYRNPPLQLLTEDKKSFQKLYEDQALFESVIRNYIAVLRSSIERATSLIRLIKEEYHFE